MVGNVAGNVARSRAIFLDGPGGLCTSDNMEPVSNPVTTDDAKKKTPTKTALPDITKINDMTDRLLRNRAALIDRYNQLPLFREARDEKEAASWSFRIMPSDPPSIQLLMMLKEELKKTDGIEDDYKRAQIRMAIMGKIADLCSNLESLNATTYKELRVLVDHHQRVKEHEDLMSLKGGAKSKNDEDLISQARAAGVSDELMTQLGLLHADPAPRAE